jgi:hypothetical protein
MKSYKGKISEGLPGSTLEHGMRGEKHPRTWEALIVPEKQVGQPKVRPTTIKESDQLIVLWGRESRPHGEGADRIRSLHRQHWPDMEGRIHNDNLLAGNSEYCGSEYL